MGHRHLFAMPGSCERSPESTASTISTVHLLLDSWLGWRLIIEENVEVGIPSEEKVKAS
jgi:hypothetical protein